jgi:hypothetical protein
MGRGWEGRQEGCVGGELGIDVSAKDLVLTTDVVFSGYASIGCGRGTQEEEIRPSS